MNLKDYEALRVKPVCAECGTPSITIMECQMDRQIVTRALCSRCVQSAIKTKKITIGYKDGLINANKTYFIRKMTHDTKAPQIQSKPPPGSRVEDVAQPNIKSNNATTITIYEHKPIVRVPRARSRLIIESEFSQDK